MSAETFEVWMRVQDYRESTILTSARTIRRLEVQPAVDFAALSKQDMGVVRRYSAFVGEVGPASDFDDAVLSLGLDAKASGPWGKGRRKRMLRSFSETDWAALWERVTLDDYESEPEDRVLEILMATGYRVGDILGVSRRNLHQAFRSGVVVVEVKGGDMLQLPLGGAQDSWERLRDEWDYGSTVAEWICPTGARGAQGGWGAYKRVQRRLYALGEILELEEPVHLHRLRRTVAVNALRTTKDIHLVSQLLGHKSVKATESYVDEARLAEIESLQQQLRGKS